MDEETRRMVEAAMPGWVVVERTPPEKPRDGPPRKVDSVGVDFEALKEKYFGTKRVSKEGEPRRWNAGPPARMVVMQLGEDETFRKTVVVRDGKVIGAQG